MIFKQVTDENFPEILRFSSRKESEVEPFNEMIIDSEKVLERALVAGVQIKSVLVSSRYKSRCISLLEHLKDVLVYEADDHYFEKLLKGRIHQDVMAIASRPNMASLSDLSDKVVFLNGVSDPQNVGAIVRNCHAFGIENVLIDSTTCSPFSRRSIRVSMGSVFSVKFSLFSSITNGLLDLKRSGFQVIASHLGKESSAVGKFEFPKKSILVIGSESCGIGAEVLVLSDNFVKIPISAAIDSLNAACASAILIEHMTR